MLDDKTLGYDFDEEGIGFGEPERAPEVEEKSPWSIGTALVALGFLVFVLAIIQRGNSWGWLLGSFGVMTAGSLLVWRERFRGTTPGIKNDGLTQNNVTAKGWIGWGIAVFLTGFYCVLYWGGQTIFGIEVGGGQLLDRPAAILDPLSMALAGTPANKWFLYGFLYTVLVLSFGVRMFWKYRHNRYQLIRTTSVMFMQLALAFIIPNVLKNAGQPEHYLSYFWPLKPDYLYPSAFAGFREDPMSAAMFLLYWGVIMTFIATPILTYFFGKRWYCSWVCGCGGLAETLGDPWRQLSDKSTRAWKVERWMIHGVLVWITVTTAAIWIDYSGDGELTAASNEAVKLYGFFIGAAFSGVVGVGFYPLMGSRVWCRFGCPMAAILGIFQRYSSRFRITTNGDQCMSCGNCSTYCEMGIDVRAYAQKGENIVRASCVGCGICSAVCPRGVLKLENGSTHKDRYAGSDKGFAQIGEDLKGPRYPV